MYNELLSNMHSHIIISNNRNSLYRKRLELLANQYSTYSKFSFCENLDQIKLLIAKVDNPILINFDNGIIIPSSVLNRIDYRAFNFHSAPPEYPGRDVHHFAIYEGAKYFGATFHRMEDKVDSGEIYDIEKFTINAGDKATCIKEKSLDISFKILEKYYLDICKNSVRQAEVKYVWGNKKYTRKMFREACFIDKSINSQELKRKIFAFSHSEFNNLYTIIGGYRFLLE